MSTTIKKHNYNLQIAQIPFPADTLMWLFQQYQKNVEMDVFENEQCFELANICFLHQPIDAQEIVENWVKKFFSDKEQLFKSVFQYDNNEELLSYAIFLNDNSIENQANCRLFLYFYEELEIAKFIPIKFRFVPKEVENEFVATEKLIQIL